MSNARSIDNLCQQFRRDQDRVKKIARLQQLVDEARASGVSERSVEDVIEDVLRRRNPK